MGACCAKKKCIQLIIYSFWAEKNDRNDDRINDRIEKKEYKKKSTA
jgi:hypothetical protein